MQFLGSGVLKCFGGVVIWRYVRVSGIAALGMTECPALRHWECQGVRHCSTMGILNAKGSGIGNVRMFGIAALGMSECLALRHRTNLLRYHKWWFLLQVWWFGSCISDACIFASWLHVSLHLGCVYLCIFGNFGVFRIVLQSFWKIERSVHIYVLVASIFACWLRAS